MKINYLEKNKIKELLNLLDWIFNGLEDNDEIKEEICQQ